MWSKIRRRRIDGTSTVKPAWSALPDANLLVKYRQHRTVALTSMTNYAHNLAGAEVDAAFQPQAWARAAA